MSIREVVDAAHAAAEAAKAAYDKAIADAQALEAKAAEAQPHLDALQTIENTLVNLSASLDATGAQVFNGVRDGLLGLVNQVRTYIDKA
jgi:hypothetical protein